MAQNINQNMTTTTINGQVINTGTVQSNVASTVLSNAQNPAINNLPQMPGGGQPMPGQPQNPQMPMQPMMPGQPGQPQNQQMPSQPMPGQPQGQPMPGQPTQGQPQAQPGQPPIKGNPINGPSANKKYAATFDFAKTPVTQIADYIIIQASKGKASDIHFDPREDGMVVRFRIDGELQDYTFIPLAFEKNLTTRLKLMANMNITETRLPQDGAIKGEFGGTYLDMRVSALPLNEGEKIVIRILDYTRSLEGIDSLGFNKPNNKKIHRMIGIPNGIILVTGATGSGKSTTTYSMLQALNKPETNIITVEDPIEMNIEGINQVQVNSDIGMTFAAALRSILRQDPNVILIGEIRDSETAQIAVRSAITGHLVLSTIHTNNALSTIERLLDMDVERYLLSTAMVGIIAQRLAKMICPKCRIKRPANDYEKKVFKLFLDEDVDEIWDANEKGCPECRKGYKGRVAIQEVLEFDDKLRSALNEKVSKEELYDLVYSDNTITLLQDGLGKILDGLTSFQEIYKTIEIETGDEEDITYGQSLTGSLDQDDDEEVKPKKKKPKKKEEKPKEKEEKVEEESKEEEQTSDDTDTTNEETKTETLEIQEEDKEEPKEEEVEEKKEEATEQVAEEPKEEDKPKEEPPAAPFIPTIKEDKPSIPSVLGNSNNNNVPGVLSGL